MTITIGLVPDQLRPKLLQLAVAAYGRRGPGFFMRIKGLYTYIPLPLLDNNPPISREGVALLRQTMATYEPPREFLVYFILSDDSEQLERYRQTGDLIDLCAPGNEG